MSQIGSPTGGPTRQGRVGLGWVVTASGSVI
jgi:hypothetical protein